MEFLSKLFDTVKGVAPTLASTITTAATGNPILGGIVASTIRGVLGKDDDGSPISELEAQAVLKDPDMYLKLKVALQDIELKKLQEETKQISIVNETMRAESMSDSKAQRGWRPFNGYLFGITLFCDYMLSQILLACITTTYVWTHIPSAVYLLWSSVLGITAASRGAEKISKTPGPGVLGVINKVMR